MNPRTGFNVAILFFTLAEGLNLGCSYDSGIDVPDGGASIDSAILADALVHQPGESSGALQIRVIVAVTEGEEESNIFIDVVDGSGMAVTGAQVTAGPPGGPFSIEENPSMPGQYRKMLPLLLSSCEVDVTSGAEFLENAVFPVTGFNFVSMTPSRPVQNEALSVTWEAHGGTLATVTLRVLGPGEPYSIEDLPAAGTMLIPASVFATSGDYLVYLISSLTYPLGGNDSTAETQYTKVAFSESL